MTWFRVDDTLAFHAKTMSAGVAAMGLWVKAGSWSSSTLTDGFIAEHMVPALSDGQTELSDRLVTSGLWDRVPGGYQFHEWAQRNPTRKQVEHARQKEADRKAEWRAKVGRTATTSDNTTDVPPGHDGVSHRDTEECPAGTNPSVPRDKGGTDPPLSRLTQPDPTRPDPSTTGGHSESLGTTSEADTAKTTAPRKRATRIPENFAVTEPMIEWAKVHTPNVGRAETDKFRDYWQAKSGRDATKLDWVATWRNWMREAEQRAGRTLVRNGANGHGPTRVPTTTARVAAIEALRRPPEER